MNFFKKKKLIIAVSLVVLGLFLANTVLAQVPAPAPGAAPQTPATNPPPARNENPAEPPTSVIGDIATGAISTVFKGIGYFLGFIAGMILGLGGWLVGFALKLNENLLASPMITLGWQIVLQFTNLGFILAIIVMAFATIFRMETYAMKQTLWKLIVAALLVNFSLVIAGAFIDIAQNLSNLFLQKVSLDPISFSTELGALFNAQGFLAVKQEVLSSNALRGVATGAFGAILNLVGSIFFTAGFTFIAALMLLAIAVMLLIRYVFLGLLLIVSPIVWLFWIFPATAEYWKKWWHHFLRWTFFAPIMLFFLYLAIISMRGSPEYFRQVLPNNAQIGTNFTFGLDVVGNFVIVLGLLFGGLMAANATGIAGAGMAMTAAQKVGKGFGGWVGRKGLKAGTWALRRPFGTETVQKGIAGMEGLGAGGKGFLGKLGKVAATPIRKLGMGLSRLSATGAEKLIDQAKKELGGLDMNRLAKMIPALPPEKQVAALQILAADGSLDLMDDITPFISQKTLDMWQRFGQSVPSYTNLTRTVGFNADMLRALREGSFDKTVTRPDGTKTTSRVSLESATQAFFQNFRPEHFSKMEVDEFFRAVDHIKNPNGKGEFGLSNQEQRTLQEQAVAGILEANPDGLSKLYGRIKGANRKNFNNNLLFPYIQGQAKAAGKSVAKWLEEDKPELHVFFESSTAKGLGLVAPE